ncbi:MAG: TonB-dependent receptor [Phycisphaerales bacterium]|nr:TonB-dependent receptor [Phycisphaerales bacterium]
MTLVGDETPIGQHSDRDHLDTPRKALEINLDRRRYGTFAEIGAGQEVVRWFFRAGGASGTIAKSMSAYDMAVSDAIYGKCDRYVSRSRLQSMLDYEHKLNLSRLGDARGDTTSFFAFADTVATRSFDGRREGHGWMGVKFQAHPRDQDSQIILHLRMLDKEQAQQQEALGIVGVNLLYGAFFYHYEPEMLLKSLLDNLSTERIEIDMIEFSGIEFRHVNNRIMSLRLVELGLSDAAMFGPGGEVLQPSEMLHNKPILVERGSFRPVTQVNLDMLKCAKAAFMKNSNGEEPVELMEVTMHNLQADGAIDLKDFLARADVLSACGKTVLISDYFEFYRLGACLARYSRKPIGIVMGVPSLIDLFDEKYYGDLDGGILDSFGRLFKNDHKLYIYPLKEPKTGKLIKVDNLEPDAKLRKLYGYLVDRGCIEQLEGYDERYLSIFSRDVLNKIKSGDESWQDMVPPVVADLIRKRGYFGYRSPAPAAAPA